jgi:hypothetical protein
LALRLFFGDEAKLTLYAEQHPLSLCAFAPLREIYNQNTKRNFKEKWY